MRLERKRGIICAFVTASEVLMIPPQNKIQFTSKSVNYKLWNLLVPQIPLLIFELIQKLLKQLEERFIDRLHLSLEVSLSTFKGPRYARFINKKTA